jgi:hypothetical protein
MSVEAMKQALEALENTYALRDDVIAAKESLRQAIADAEKQEPVAWRYSFTHSSAIGHGDYDIGPLVTDNKEVAFGVGCFGQEPLYTRPYESKQKRAVSKTHKPLTEDEILKLRKQAEKAWQEAKYSPPLYVFDARAIEAAHGIKEKNT